MTYSNTSSSALKKIAASPLLAGGAHRYTGPQSTTYRTTQAYFQSLREETSLPPRRQREEVEGILTPGKVLEEPEQMREAG